MQHYLDAFKNYADFHGRATREQYWMFVLFNIIFFILAILIDTALLGIPIGLFSLLYQLITLIPSFSIAVRRLHDSGRSGFMLFIGLIPFIGSIWLLILFVLPSEKEDSAYGEYRADVLDSEIDIKAFDHKKADKAILIFLSWLVFTSLFWRIATLLEIISFYGKSYMIVLILQALISGALTVNLATALKENSKRAAGLVIAIILVLVELYRAFEIYSQFGGSVYAPY